MAMRTKDDARHKSARRETIATSLCIAPARAQAPNWPQRPVRVLVPFAAGGNIDVIARLTAQRMSEVFGQQFVIENRVGGNGTIAGESAARAAADGYTLFWAG